MNAAEQEREGGEQQQQQQQQQPAGRSCRGDDGVELSSVDDTAAGHVTGQCSKMEQATDQQQEQTTAIAGNGSLRLKRPRPSTANNNNSKSPKTKLRVSLLHSEKYTNVLDDTMKHIHQDRDRLLSSLLLCCGFLRQTPAFFTVVEPKRATRSHLERFHCPVYLDLLEYALPAQEGGGIDDTNAAPSYAPRTKDFHAVLDSYGLTEDCHLPEDPEGRALLWRYCQYVAGASLHAAHLLLTDRADVAINWGGGRHHAHTDRAGGFCFVNDAVLAIQHLLGDKRGGGGGHGGTGAHDSLTDASSGLPLAEKKRVLYLDIDIHHADGVQSAFYHTDQVLTVSFHRRAPGFFPPSGDPSEKGRSGTDGVGFALNLPLPKQTTSDEFVGIFTLALDKLVLAYDPNCIVLCVGSDGIKGDPVVGAEGWNLTPEGLAECIRLTANRCGGYSRSSGGAKPRKLLVLGAGGYHPTNAARTFLLSTAAACEGARPGMLWNELPKDVPQHEFFGRYGPEFQLISQGLGVDLAGRQQTSKVANTNCASSYVDPRTHDDRTKAFDDATKSVDVCALFVQSKRESLASVSFNSKADDEFKGKEGDWAIGPRKKKTSGGGGKRRKRSRKAVAGSARGAADDDASSCASNSRSTATFSAASEEENC